MGINTISEQCISGPICKLVELPDGYAINGSMYDKVNTAPIPKAFLPILSSAACGSIMREMATVGHGYVGLKTKRSYLIDKDDSNIVYLIVPYAGTWNTTLPTFYKLKRNNGRYTVLGTVPANALGTNYYYDCDILDDDSKYVYVKYRTHYANGYGGVWRINKTTFAVTELSNINAVNAGGANCLSFYPNIINGKIYFSYGASAAQIGIGIINLDTFTSSNVVSTVTCTNGFYQYMKPKYENNCIIFYGLLTAKELYKMSYDISTGILTSTVEGTIPSDVSLTYNTALTYMSVIPNKDYVVVVSRNEMGTPAGVAERRVVLFKKNTETSKMEYGTILDAGFKHNTFLIAEADDLIYLCNKFRVDVISITEARSLLKVQSVAANYLATIGRDNLGNIILVSDDTTVSVFNREIPIVISAKFEKEYEYSDTPIASYLEIGMQSHLGKAVTGNVKVELMGPVIFTDGTQSKTVTVSGTTQVPIVIVGYGDMRYNITNE